jgi:hypothetical protein
MKPYVGMLAGTLVLSLLVWTLFYVLTPDAPLGSQETLVIVGMCGGIVLLGRSIVSRFRKPRSPGE